MNTPCLHENFACQCNVGRLTDTEGGPVTHYTVDVTIHCTDCGEPFEFFGLPVGHSSYKPMVSFDGTELRAPIMPHGKPPPQGLPGFGVRLVPVGKVND